MKKIVFAVLITNCFCLNVWAADPVSVNGKPIKQSLVEFILKDAVAQGKTVDDNLKAEVIEKLIVSELIDQEARRNGIDQQPDFLAKAELTLHDLRINAFVEDYVKNNPIDDQAVQSEYNKLQAHLSGKEYKASHILVKSREEAIDVIAQLAKGADFTQLAKAQTLDAGSKDSGGDLGWFLPDDMVKPFGAAVSALQEGRYTTVPVQTEFGWHVIRLDAMRDAQVPTLDAVKNEIRNNLQRQQLDQLVASLRAKAQIVRNTDTAK